MHRDGYLWTDAPDPHAARRRVLIAGHPEVRRLIGSNPWTSLVGVGLVGLQLVLAWWLRAQPIYVILLVAWCVGAFVTHALWGVVHEAGHGLVFGNRHLDAMVAVFANLPMGIPSGVSYGIYHHHHHLARGDYQEDADLAAHWEARWVGGSGVRKFLWLCAFTGLQSLRTRRFSANGRIGFVTPWVVANIVVGFAFDACLVWAMGWGAFVYLLASLVFSVGPHPLAGRWIQEHFVVAQGQETYSYYGLVNFLSLNMGYHNEHHDLPGVPWNRLPRLKAMAPELYEPLVSHRSWGRLLWRFLTDPSLTLYSRVSRDVRASRVGAAEP